MEEKLNLNGKWQFKEKDADEWENGCVPGSVQQDLVKLGKMPDPYYRMNEAEFSKLEGKEWIYKREFNFNKNGGYDSAKLVFEGIDTIAEIYFNGKYIGKAQDMFVPKVFDVTDAIKEGKNTIEVYFESIVKHIGALQKDSPSNLTSSMEIGRPYIRKAQYSFGWDWGPRILQVGLWRDVYISLAKDAEIENPYVYTKEIRDNKAYINVSADVDLYKDINVESKITVSYGNKIRAVKTADVDKGKIDTSIEIDNPDLWYPNGYGMQPIYSVDIELYSEDKLIDKRNVKTGIRDVKLIRKKDTEGESFIFEINGIKIFAKGADWIPADNLLPRLTRDDYYKYIKLAKEANMNMLRIWGGGIYEDDAFYEACDEMGIMVWQDFMYACAQYPDEYKWFRDIVYDESEKVVLSLRNHPSIVLWCGNNENNWGFYSWWGLNDPEYLGNFIYKEILPEICSKYDPSRPYWVSSPYGGVDPNSEAEGDRHQWVVWSNWADYGHYQNDKGRFISEFGFQSMPDYKTILSCTAPEDRYILSPVTISHNKMVEGTERLIRFMVGRIGFPKDFKSFVYLTQFNQAEAIKFGVEHWRSRKFMTAGTLYWQLNDCWPVASWSCLDYYKRKKALYYYSKHFYSDVMAYIKSENGGITVSGISDLLENTDATVKIKAYKLNGEKTFEKDISTTLIANDVTKISFINDSDFADGYVSRTVPVSRDGFTYPEYKNGNMLDTVVYVDMVVKGRHYENYLVFDRFRNLNLSKPDIKYSYEGNTLKLQSDIPAFGVFIETENETDLSDNCINMMPGKEYKIVFTEDPGKLNIFDITELTAKI